MIGIENDRILVTMDYKNHLQVLANRFTTFACSFDTREKNKKFAWGLALIHDKSGKDTYTSNSATFSFAKNIQISKKNKAVMAIQAGCVQKYIDVNKLTWNNQFDGTGFDMNLPSGENSDANYFIPDISAGSVWETEFGNGKEMRAGIAAHHLTNPVLKANNIASIAIGWNVSGMATLPIDNSLMSIQPSFLFSKQAMDEWLERWQGVPRQRGFNARYTPDRDASYLSAGVFLKTNNALIFAAGISFDEQMSFTFSYDIGTRQNLQGKSGGLEFSVNYSIR